MEFQLNVEMNFLPKTVALKCNKRLSPEGVSILHWDGRAKVGRLVAQDGKEDLDRLNGILA